MKRENAGGSTPSLGHMTVKGPEIVTPLEMVLANETSEAPPHALVSPWHPFGADSRSQALKRVSHRRARHGLFAISNGDIGDIFKFLLWLFVMF